MYSIISSNQVLSNEHYSIQNHRFVPPNNQRDSRLHCKLSSWLIHHEANTSFDGRDEHTNSLQFSLGQK